MDQTNQSATPNGEVSVVLIQHWASMITGLRERADHASEQARIAQHQVHVLSRNNDQLDIALRLEQARSQRLERNLQDLARFTINALMWFPDITNEHFLVREYNRVIGEFNQDQIIDLADTESESDEE